MSLAKKLSAKEILVLFVVIVVGAGFIYFIRYDAIEQEKGKALLIANSVAASLPRESLDSIPENIEEIRGQSFSHLKIILRQVTAQNLRTKFSYLYILRNERLYFLVDSEMENSIGFSPSGEEITDAKPIDFLPFKTGKSQITPPIKDRWGTWVTAEVPILDNAGKAIAVFGMDYDAQSWKYRIWGETAESSMLVVLAILLFLAFIRNKAKNRKLRDEVTLRTAIELQIREKETNYRSLFEFNPKPILVSEPVSGKILEVNAAAVKKYGYKEEEFTSMLVGELEANTSIDQASTGKIREHRLKNGNLIQVKVHSHPFEYNRKAAILHLIVDVTDSLRTERELLEKQLQLSNIVKNLPGFVYRCDFDKDYTMSFISDACLRITGYSPYQFATEKSISFNDIIVPEYRDAIREKWEKALQSNSHFEDTYPIITASGETRWLWERGYGIQDVSTRILHLEGYIEDVTDRKNTEQQLKQLSRAVEQNPTSIVITDAEGNIEYVNPVFTEITGYESDEVIGKNPRILKSGKMDDSIFKELWSTIISGGTWKGEIINRRKSGELYWDNKTISAIFNSQGHIMNYVGVGEEITKRKKIEEELIKAKERAEESDRLKSAFLANISHEIRTPMNGILGFADLLKSPDLSDEHHMEFIEIIEKSGQRMLSIINDLIDISKIEAGEIAIRIKSVNIDHMMKEIQMFFTPEAKQKNILLNYQSIQESEKLIIKTDSVKLSQILTNLIKNSIKFTDTGTITFGYQPHGSSVKFFVSDTGIGISPEQKDLIFERFRQGTASATRKHDGAGLGLAISKAYIELLGGFIMVESELGKGSNFIFELPVDLTESASQES